MDSKRSVVQAVAIKNGKIMAVGSGSTISHYIGTSTEVIDLHGQTMLPGFIDAHIHLVAGSERLTQCSMDGEALTAAQIVARAQTCLASDTGGSTDWFQIVNINPAGLVMTRADLDQISGTRPIWAAGIDGHTGWANTAALAAAGITTGTLNPTGGVIARDAAGNATGSLLDNAQALVTSVIPEQSMASRKATSLQALALARSKGITTIQDAFASETVMNVYKALETDGTLNMRVRANLASEIGDDEAEYARLNAIRTSFANDPLIRADGVKIFADGVIEYPTQTAAMLKPYLDDSGNPTTNYGGRYFDQATLNKYITRLDAEGFRINVHAIGNYTTRAVLDAFEQMIASNGVRSRQHQISHLEVVDPADIPRLGRLGVYANMQLFWALPDVYTIEALKPYIDADAHRYLYPAKSLLSGGATIIGGSDWPVDAAPGDLMANTPLRSIYMGVTRTNPLVDDGHHGEVLYADEQVDRETMIAAYTINAAKSLGMDKEVGSIEVGKNADFVIFDQDITNVDIKTLFESVDVAATVFAGKTVYSRPAVSSASKVTALSAGGGNAAQVHIKMLPRVHIHGQKE